MLFIQCINLGCINKARLFRGFSNHAGRWTIHSIEKNWRAKKKKKVLKFAYKLTYLSICCITVIMSKYTKGWINWNVLERAAIIIAFHTTLYSSPDLPTMVTTCHGLNFHEVQRWLLCFCAFHHHSSSTGYLPVRQAVQWPSFLLALLLVLICSFSYDSISLWTAVNRPSTDR